MRFIIPSLVAWVAATAVSAHATTLTFDGVPSGSIGATFNTGFGDRVTAAGAGLNLAGGATPNIVLNFVSLLPGNPNFEVYSSGYSGLLSALGDNNFDVPGYVEFLPDAGWDVVLEGFDIGAWSSSSYPNSQVRVVDAVGTTLFDSGVFTFPGSTVSQFLTAPIRSSSALRLYINDFGDLGLDNVRFSQAVSTVPEPSAWALCLTGAAALAWAARARRAGGNVRKGSVKTAA